MCSTSLPTRSLQRHSDLPLRLYCLRLRRTNTTLSSRDRGRSTRLRGLSKDDLWLFISDHFCLQRRIVWKKFSSSWSIYFYFPHAILQVSKSSAALQYLILPTCFLSSQEILWIRTRQLKKVIDKILDLDSRSSIRTRRRMTTNSKTPSISRTRLQGSWDSSMRVRTPFTR